MRNIKAYSLLLLSTLAIRWPVFLSKIHDVDEGWYYTIAQVLMKGGILYKDVVDVKPPLLYFLYTFFLSLVNSMHFVHAVTIAWIALTAFIIKKTIALYARGYNPWLGALAYTIFSTIYFPTSLATNSEILFNLPLSLSFYYWIKKDKSTSYFWAGLFIALAILIKQTIIFNVAIYSILFVKKPNSSNEPKIKYIKHFIFGLSVPLGASAIYFLVNKAFDDYLFWVIKFNFILPASQDLWSSINTFSSFILTYWLPLWILLIFTIVRYLQTKLPYPKNIFYSLILQLGASLIVCFITLRSFDHYFLQVLPFLILLTIPNLSLMVKAHKYLKVIYVSLIILITISGVKNLFSVPSWVKQMNRVSQVTSNYVKEQTVSSDTIFIWGNLPTIYSYANKLPPNKFISTSFIARNHNSLEGWSLLGKQLIDNLQSNKPSIIINVAPINEYTSDKYNLNSFPAMKQFIEENYVFETSLEKAEIYRLKDI